MTMTFTFFGTSDAQGVPRMMCTCAVCTYASNHRTRPSACLSTADGLILLDVSPDFRQQFLAHNNMEVPQTVFITHAHNDHIGGLGDYADLCFWHQKATTVVSAPEVNALLETKYHYLSKRETFQFLADTRYDLTDWQVTFHKVNHGFNGYSYGILFTEKTSNFRWAYLSDAFRMTEEQWAPFRDLDLLILGTSFWEEKQDPNRRSVYSVCEALVLKEEMGIGQLILTHLSHDIDLEVRTPQLPPDVQFAREGMELDIAALVNEKANPTGKKMELKR